MAWSDRWIAASMERTTFPRYALECVPEGIDQPLSLSSHDEGSHHLPVILPMECAIRWGRLSLDSWTMGPSSLTITTLEVDGLTRVRPGSVFILRIGWSGWSVADYETVWVGSLDQVTQDGRGRMVWSFTGLEGALHQRLQVYGSERAELFGELVDEPSSVTTGAPTPHLPVTTNHWSKPLDGVYGLRLLHTDGDWRYITATDYVSGEFTGLTDALGLGLDGWVPPSGTEVRGWVADRGHPIQIALRILTSIHGDEANGDFDVYPREWGLGLPGELVDDADAQLSMLLSGPGGSALRECWWLHMERAIDSAHQWLTSWLAQGGYWICQRQGQLTVRGLQVADTRVQRSITDDEIVDVRHVAYGGPAEAASFAVRDQADLPGTPRTLGFAPGEGATASAISEDLRAMLGRMGEVLYPVPITDDPQETQVDGQAWSRPTQGLRRRDIPVWGTDTQRELWRDSIQQRVGSIALVRVQEVEVDILGWDGAAPGDQVLLHTGRVHSRRDDDDCVQGGTHIVIGGGPDFFGATTQLYTIHVPPTEQG